MNKPLKQITRPKKFIFIFCRHRERIYKCRHTKRQNKVWPEPGPEGILISIIFYFSTYLIVLGDLVVLPFDLYIP